MLAEDTRFAPADTLAWNDAGDELALFDRATESYFALNAAAVAIWRQLVAGRTVGETVDALTAQFDSPRETTADDVAAFVRDALERHLLVARG